MQLWDTLEIKFTESHLRSVKLTIGSRFKFQIKSNFKTILKLLIEHFEMFKNPKSKLEIN